MVVACFNDQMLPNDLSVAVQQPIKVPLIKRTSHLDDIIECGESPSKVSSLNVPQVASYQ